MIINFIEIFTTDLLISQIETILKLGMVIFRGILDAITSFMTKLPGVTKLLATRTLMPLRTQMQTVEISHSLARQEAGLRFAMTPL